MTEQTVIAEMWYLRIDTIRRVPGAVVVYEWKADDLWHHDEIASTVLVGGIQGGLKRQAERWAGYLGFDLDERTGWIDLEQARGWIVPITPANREAA